MACPFCENNRGFICIFAFFFVPLHAYLDWCVINIRVQRSRGVNNP